MECETQRAVRCLEANQCGHTPLLLPVSPSPSLGVRTGRQKWSPKLANAHKHRRPQFSHALWSLALFKGMCGVLEARMWFSSYFWITDALIVPRLAVSASESRYVTVDSQHKGGLCVESFSPSLRVPCPACMRAYAFVSACKLQPVCAWGGESERPLCAQRTSAVRNFSKYVRLDKSN